MDTIFALVSFVKTIVSIVVKNEALLVFYYPVLFRNPPLHQ